MGTTLLLEIEEGIALLTLNRPASLNALNHALLGELEEAVVQLEQDSQLRAAVLIGAGVKAFAAGADIAELAGLDSRGAAGVAARGQGILRRLERLPKPVIAAVNGFALGGGCELAMACHLRLAAPHARFGQPEVNLGLIPGYGGTQRLARLVGRGRATELCLTGAIIGAEEALRMGLVNRVVTAWAKDAQGEPVRDDKGQPVFDREAFLEAALSLARDILGKAPLAVAGCLAAIDRGFDLPLDAGLAVERDLFAACFGTEDMREGTAAFLEKRPAQFRGC
ncbi:MAG: enoyl-CoA hydratase-related protein [bacterium]|jgi:enoyl-CoA hydratase|nr:enoyl-CoA hydratase-related protein [bacterium]